MLDDAFARFRDRVFLCRRVREADYGFRLHANQAGRKPNEHWSEPLKHERQFLPSERVVEISRR